ncbi:hypothetical protein X798_05722 [Onchocerca flexuosa]|uniref:Uncharacterized protein n=2 Tax=Onchocerca flexuosa TaxID=387005 RepID=A0A183H864_9BILA|nr:hypothetical protein X798_05722 [Onchocerca flexuosa]VDO37388.1 unnamed protein product [Onchocerca flexuosa]
MKGWKKREWKEEEKDEWDTLTTDQYCLPTVTYLIYYLPVLLMLMLWLAYQCLITASICGHISEQQQFSQVPFKFIPPISRRKYYLSSSLMSSKALFGLLE